MPRVNEIFEKDIATRMAVINSNDTIIYTDPLMDQ